MESKDFQDKGFDRVMRQLIADSTAAEPVVEEIADSPQLWWSVKREIEAQRSARKTPWPPVSKLKRWLLIAGPTAAVAALFLSVVVLRPNNTLNGENAKLVTRSLAVSRDPSINDAPAEPLVAVHKTKAAYSSIPQRKYAGRTAEHSATVAKRSHTPEFKTDFIALSYAKDPSSGQILRVKVPSSMMVSVGLVQSVPKPSELVDAEVLLGDDGLTRAIRFIRQ
ncbi:MAG: hypothetical protein JO053_14745 [Acidobacteria bacterium]|nr:hypothetical protein [Acidobacteriota bacterium]